MTIASMMPVALNMICRSAAPIGPFGSSTPSAVQPPRTATTIKKISMPNRSARFFMCVPFTQTRQPSALGAEMLFENLLAVIAADFAGVPGSCTRCVEHGCDTTIGRAREQLDDGVDQLWF